MPRASVVVVGGGIAGLAAAWELTGGARGPGEAPRVEVIEADDHFGGPLVTAHFAGRTVDLGPDGFLAYRPEATTLARELGLGDDLEAIDASGASLWLRAALDEIPAGLALGVPTSSAALRGVHGLTWRARLHARRDELLPRRFEVGEDASIGEIVRAKLGDELAYQFVEPMVGGIQAGRIDRLSARSLFPALLDAARRGGSLMKALRPKDPAPTADGPRPPMFYSLTGGVGSLPSELVRQLDARGVALRAKVRVTALRRAPSGAYPWEVDTDDTTTPADAVVLAVPAPVAGRLLGSFDERLESLQRVESAGAAMVTMSVERSAIQLPEHGTGVLVPLGTSWKGSGTMMVTAVTFLDRKWPHLRRDEDVILRAHVGRIDDRRWADLDDAALVARVGEELTVLLARCGVPAEAIVQRFPEGLPQYYVGHQQMVEQAKAASAPLRVALAGNAYDGVGIPASIGSGRRAGREVLELLARGWPPGDPCAPAR
jgi:protoporphyrinogen/coproporphyrinogen III oxidase